MGYKMKAFKTLSIVCLLVVFSGCARVVTQDEYEVCIWGTSVTGAALGAFGGVAGSAGGAAGGAALGSFLCGEVGADPVTTPAAPLDSDMDGVPDSHDKCPGTPKGVSVDADGCPLDSDGDGVPDYRDDCPGTAQGLAVDEKGCVEPDQIVFTLDGVNFEYDSAVLTASAESTLNEAIAALRNNPSISVMIIGHTDSRGSESYNQNLSQRRAESVLRYLVDHGGIDSSRLSATGKGESEPVASNDNESGRAKNRRVELVTK